MYFERFSGGVVFFFNETPQMTNLVIFVASLKFESLLGVRFLSSGVVQEICLLIDQLSENSIEYRKKWFVL